jgi:EAL domain-containing protein (putative c-di-GMP-specific phosphodiesterase class I)
VLKKVSGSIQKSTRGSDLVFRWGGDEFVVILSNADRTGILIAADRIRKAIQKIGGQFGVDLDLSIGVALYPEHGTNEDELICLADRALYIAKKGGYRVYIGAEEYEINEHSVRVVFQPVMDILSKERLGFEALCRDPDGKLSVPEFFKKYNAIGQLSELKRICFLSQLRIAEEMGLKRVFLNIDFDLLSRITPVPKSSTMEVILEISELEALKDLEKRLEIAAKWRSAGYQFAIDDFGAGFVSLPFIARLIPEYIKIDRSMILQAVSSRPFGGFLKSLLQALSSYVTKGIIAEGVEREEELQVVKDIGIFMVQGYLFGRPEALQ